MEMASSVSCHSIPHSIVSVNIFITASLDIAALTLPNITDCTFPEGASVCAVTESSVAEVNTDKNCVQHQIVSSSYETVL